MLLNNGNANVNALDCKEGTPLHKAAEFGHTETVKMLLKNGANVNAFDCEEGTPLHKAAEFGHTKTVKVLLNNGANVNAINCGKSSPLHEAANGGHTDTVRVLLNNEANVSVVDQNNETALHRAISSGVIKIINLLIFYKSVIDALNSDGKSSLHLAIETGNRDIALYLLDNGANPNTCDTKGNTALMDATERNEVGIVRALLDKAANPNARNNEDKTALHIASDWRIAQKLLKKGCWPNVQECHRGNTPLLTRAKCLGPSSHYMYKSESPDESVLTQFEQIMSARMDPWISNDKGETVLGLLLLNRNIELAHSLIDAMKVAEPNCFKKQHKNGDTLLHVTCGYEAQEIIELLLENRSNVNEMNKSNFTPLHITCQKIKDLATAKQGTNNITNTGYYWAANRLIKYGADPTIQNEDGKSCFVLAEGIPELNELLTKPVELIELPQLLKWESTSLRHQDKIAQVVRSQRSQQIGLFHFHTEPIGSGAFSNVYAGVHETDGREVAVKRVVTHKLCRSEDQREIKNLVNLPQCEYIVRYLQCISDKNFSYIMLELMEGTLDEYMRSRNDATANNEMCKNIVQGLDFLHQNKILHRDIKPTNILYKTMPSLCLKIADFGLSIKMDGKSGSTVWHTKTGAGTRCWMPPELLTAPGKVKPSEASDVFSCGLVLHFILSETKHPFEPADADSRTVPDVLNATERNVMNDTFTIDTQLTPEAVHLVTMMLDNKDSSRPSATRVLTHPFFWSNKKKVSFLCSVGNQPEIEMPRYKVSAPSQVEQHLENVLGTEFASSPWDLRVPRIYYDMSSYARGRRYEITSAVDLLRFVRNAYAHISDAKRPTPMKKLLLEDFVFFTEFPSLLIEVYKAVVQDGWDHTREEIEYNL